MRKKTVAVVSAAVLTAGLGIGVSQVASAETPTPTPTATSSTERPDHSGRKGGGHSGKLGVSLADLATKLGVEQSKLSEAVSAAREATKSTERTKPTDQTQAEREASRAERQAAFAKALAGELGIDEAKVTTALTELRAERETTRAAEKKAILDQAVTDGKLTQAEADAVQKAADQGIVRIAGSRGR